MIKILDRIERSFSFWFLVATSFFFFLLRLPSLFEPNWYGDESIYQVIGMALTHGRLLYRDIWDNKPPLLYLIYALWNGNQFWVRLTALFVGILSIILFFFLAKKLLIKKQGEKTPALIFFLTCCFAFLFGIPFLEGNIANAENFMILPALITSLIILNIEDKTKPKVFLAGIIIGISFLCKVVALFDFTAFFLFLVITNYKSRKTLFLEIKKLLPFIAGFFLPIVITSVFFIIKHAFSFFIASFTQNVGYVGYGNNFIIPQGFLLVKLLLLGIFVLILFLKRKSIETSTLFIWLWSGFSLYNAFFSGRGYTHYLLVLLPGFILLLGLCFIRNKAQTLTVLFTILIGFLTFHNFILYTKNISYYQNFISFVNGSKSVKAYQSFFDPHVVFDYQVAQLINSRTAGEKTLFLWGNNAEIYVLTHRLPPGKYIVAYHIMEYKNGLEETQSALKNIKPQFIVISQNNFPFSASQYQQVLMIGTMSIYEKLF